MELLEPLRFERRFVEKIWGGRALERRPGIELPAGMRVGETWEIVDRADGSSVVAVGAHRGRTLRELMEEHGRAILGSAPPTSDGRFPLLVKYLDASKNLSVQTHPDDETAARIGGGAEGKTEAWYFLDVARGGAIYTGPRPEVSPEDFAAVADGPAVVETMFRWDVAAGECMVVPGGTVHAIGAGVTLLEVQQNSDTTYRLWDWGRVGDDGRPRATHVAEALRSVRFGRPERPPVQPIWEHPAEGLERAPFARTTHFGMNALRVSARVRLSTGGQFQIYAVVGGSGMLKTRATGEEHPLRPGDTWLVPAAVGFHYVEPEGELTLVQLLKRS
ncbi:MAG: class I mannose-6-phosphate isomerase [Planctomycetota bacterium]|nr:class I mannose-6-phosphate isomerase [Planctomycetota bacterium]